MADRQTEPTESQAWAYNYEGLKADMDNLEERVNRLEHGVAHRKCSVCGEVFTRDHICPPSPVPVAGGRTEERVKMHYPGCGEIRDAGGQHIRDTSSCTCGGYYSEPSPEPAATPCDQSVAAGVECCGGPKCSTEDHKPTWAEPAAGSSDQEDLRAKLTDEESAYLMALVRAMPEDRDAITQRHNQLCEMRENVEAALDDEEAAHAETLSMLNARKEECDRLRDDHNTACKTVAAMHAAAVGEVRGLKVGVVEDVAEVRAQLLDAMKFHSHEMQNRVELEAKVVRLEDENNTLSNRLCETKSDIAQLTFALTNSESAYSSLRGNLERADADLTHYKDRLCVALAKLERAENVIECADCGTSIWAFAKNGRCGLCNIAAKTAGESVAAAPAKPDECEPEDHVEYGVGTTHAKPIGAGHVPGTPSIAELDEMVKNCKGAPEWIEDEPASPPAVEPEGLDLASFEGHTPGPWRRADKMGWSGIQFDRPQDEALALAAPALLERCRELEKDREKWIDACHKACFKLASELSEMEKQKDVWEGRARDYQLSLCNTEKRAIRAEASLTSQAAEYQQLVEEAESRANRLAAENERLRGELADEKTNREMGDECLGMVAQRLAAWGCHHGTHDNGATPPMMYDDWVSCVVTHNCDKVRAELAAELAASRADVEEARAIAKQCAQDREKAKRVIRSHAPAQTDEHGMTASDWKSVIRELIPQKLVVGHIPAGRDIKWDLWYAKHFDRGNGPQKPSALAALSAWWQAQTNKGGSQP